MVYAYFYLFCHSFFFFCYYRMNEEVDAYAINIRMSPNRNNGLNFFIRIFFRGKKIKKKNRNHYTLKRNVFSYKYRYLLLLFHTHRSMPRCSKAAFVDHFVFCRLFLLLFLRINVIQSILQPIFICDLHFILCFICNVARKKTHSQSFIHSSKWVIVRVSKNINWLKLTSYKPFRIQFIGRWALRNSEKKKLLVSKCVVSTGIWKKSQNIREANEQIDKWECEHNSEPVLKTLISVKWKTTDDREDRKVKLN